MNSADRLRGDRFLWVVIALGALLRFWRIAGDLPYVFHYDEPTLVDNAVWLIQHGSLNPGFFHYPSGLIYALAILFGIVAAGGAAFGGFDGIHGAVAWLSSRTYPQPAEGGVLYFYPTTGLPALYLIGRGVSAIAGVVTIALAYAIGSRLAAGGTAGSLPAADGSRAAGGRGLARVAALAVAISPIAVENSRLITTDMTAAAVATAGLLAILAAEGGSAKRWILAGGVGGAAAGVKYNAGLVVLLLPLLAIWKRGDTHPPVGGAKRPGASGGGLGVLHPRPLGPLRLLGLGAAASVVAFLITTPFALLDATRFVRDLAYEFRRIGTPPLGGEAIEGTSVEKIASVFLSNLGIPGIVALAWGCVVALRSRRFARVALVAWVAILLLPLLCWKSLYARYLLPAWPGVLLLSSLGIVDAAERGRRSLRHIPPAAAIALLCVVVLAPGAVRLGRLEAKWTGRDPRVAMTDWIDRNVPEGEKIVSERGGPFPDPRRYAIERIDFLGRSSPGAYRAKGIRYLAGTGREGLAPTRKFPRELMENLAAIRAESDLAWSKGRYAIYRLRGGAAWQDTVREAIAAGEARRALAILDRKVRTTEGMIPFTWRKLAEARRELGDTTGAMEAWWEAARLDSTDVEALLALGALLTSTGRWEEALGCLRRALAISPRDPMANHNVAVVLLYRARERIRSGLDPVGARADWEGARESAALAAKISPGDPEMTGILDQVMRMGRRWGFVPR